MKYDTRLEFFKDLNKLKPSQIEDEIDSFTNSDTDRYNRLVNSFMEYLKEGIFTAYKGYSHKSTGNEIHFFTGDHHKGNAVLEFSERFGLIRNSSIEWKEIKITNTNPIDERLLYFEVISSKFQKACNVLFLNKILVTNLNSKPTGSINKEINNTEADKSKSKKWTDKWHALHYKFYLVARGSLQKHQDPFGGYIKEELEEEGRNRCKAGSTGQYFYKVFKDIDPNNLNLLKKEFGNDWEDKILKLSEKDQITIDYINKKYK